MNTRIKIDGGWIIEIDIYDHVGTYKIVKILARFGDGILLPINTTEFTQEQWDIFHARIDIKETINKEANNAEE